MSWIKYINRVIEQFGTLASIDDESPNHRRYYHIHYPSPMFTPTCWKHRRYVADVSAHYEPLCTSPNGRQLFCAARRCSAIIRLWFLATKYQEKVSMHASKFFWMSRCLGEEWRLLAHVTDHFQKYWYWQGAMDVVIPHAGGTTRINCETKYTTKVCNRCHTQINYPLFR